MSTEITIRTDGPAGETLIPTLSTAQGYKVLVKNMDQVGAFELVRGRCVVGGVQRGGGPGSVTFQISDSAGGFSAQKIVFDNSGTGPAYPSGLYPFECEQGAWVNVIAASPGLILHFYYRPVPE